MAEHDDEPKVLAPDTPADTLHAHVEKHISLPDHEKFENEPLMNELTAHPNLQSHSIEKLYNHMMDGSSPELSESGQAEPYSYEWADNLLSHPNAPQHIKKDFLNRTYHPDNPASDVHEKLADSGVATDDELRALADKSFKAGEIPHGYSQLPPAYYMQHFKEGSQNPEAQEGIAEYGLRGLQNSKGHTKESLDQAIEAIHNNKYHELDTENYKTPDNAALMSRFVSNRPDLSKTQLNRISQMLDSTPSEHRYSADDAVDNLLQHPNVDPSLLAKYATAKDARSYALSHPNLPKQSMDAFVKRVKDVNGNDRHEVDALLENPSISKEHVKGLIAKGSRAAVHHRLADESDVRNAWNASGKTAEDARNIMSAKNIPPDILKDLVGHKNQDIAISALQHPKADMDVVQAGLSRKARAVQDEARLHPLVAEQQAREGLASGKTSMSKAYADSDFKEHFDRLPKAQQDEIFKSAHQKYSGQDLTALAKSTKERPEQVLHSKLSMAMDQRVSPEIRDKQAKDITSMFKKNVGSNKEMRSNKSDVLSEHHGDESRLTRAVSQLAESGDKGAQAAILSNPAMTQSLSSHVDLKKADPEFLENAYRQAMKYDAKAPNIYDDHGRPEKFSADSTLKSLFRSDNLPDHVFQEIASNKDAMDKIGAGDEFKRYDSLPEADQRQRYTEVLNGGSLEAAKSIMQTKAPRDIFDRAISMMPAHDRDETIGQHIKNVKQHRPDIYSNAALGVYNEGESDKAQDSALQHLDPANVNDHALLKQALSAQEGDPTHINNERVLQNVPSEILHSDDMINHVAQSGNAILAHRMVGSKINEMASHLHGQDKQEKADAIMASLQQRAATLPPSDAGSDNPVARNWYDMISNSGERDNRYNYSRNRGEGPSRSFQSLHAAGANLDFMADMPGYDGQRLRQAALKNDLLSSEKVAQVAQSGTLKDVLSIANPDVKRHALDSWLDKPDLSSDELGNLSNNLNQTLLNSEAHTGGRPISMSDTAYSEYSRKLNNIIDKVSEKSPDNLFNVIHNAMNTTGSYKDLTKSDQEKISKDVMEHVSSLPYATPQSRNQAMYDTYKALNRHDLMSDKDKSRIEKQVIDSKDYETLIQMASERNLSDKGTDFLAKAARQPELLSSKEIAGLSTQMNGRTEPQTVVNMAKTFEIKLAQEQAAGGGKDHAASKIKFMDSLSSTFNPSSDTSTENNVKNEFIVNYTKKLAQDPKIAPYANSKLMKMASRLGQIDTEKGVDLMLSLPESQDAFHDFKTESMSVDMANNSRFMEAAQSGWKLSQLAANADRLTGSNASILVQRALSEGGAHLDKEDLMRELNDNDYVQAEDSVKLGRSMDHKTFSNLVSGTENALEGNLPFIAHSRLADIDTLAKDPNMAAHGAPHMGFEHREAIMNQVQTLSQSIMKCVYEPDIVNTKEKLEAVDKMVTGIHGHAKAVSAALKAEIAKSGYNIDIGKTHQTIKAVAQDLSAAQLKLGRDQCLKILDLVHEFHSLDAAANMKLTEQTDTFDIVSNVVEKAEGFEDQDWREMFSKLPHSMYSLSKRGEVPTEALAAINYTDIENAPAPAEGEASAQALFAKESMSWFGKMSKEDQLTHGKSIMDMYMHTQAKGLINAGVYQKAMLNAIPHMAQHMDRSDLTNMLVNTKDHSVVQNLFREAVKAGAGGEEGLKMYVRDHNKIMGEELFRGDIKDFKAYQGGDIAKKLEPVVSSPYLNDELSGRVCAQFVANPEAMESAMNKMLENKATPESAVTRMADQVMSNAGAKYARFDESISLSLAKQLLQHPKIDEKRFMELGALADEEYGPYIAPSSSFNPAYTNPTHGGKLFRSRPVVVPKSVPNVDEGNTVTSLNVKSDEYNKMRDIMGLIPAEGMSWVDFKRKFPQQEKGLPKSVKDVFMSAQNKPVMPEQFAAAMHAMDDTGSKYHITFSEWTSKLQRHRGEDQKPNLVVQVNNSEEKEKELTQDPKLWALYQYLLRDANGIDVEDNKVGLHPTTPHLVSWSRIDTDQNKGSWVIEEYQSDFAQKFRANLNSIISSSPGGMKLDGHAISAEDMRNYSKVINKHLEDWADASMQAVIQNAKAQGITKLYMHGPEVRGAMSSSQYSREFWDNRNTKPKTVGFRKIYGENPRKYGFGECDYTDYPKYSNEFLGRLNAAKLSTKCWVLDLGAPDQRPKKRKKPNLG